MAGDIELGGIPSSSEDNAALSARIIGFYQAVSTDRELRDASFNYKLFLVSTPLYMATFRDLNSSQDAYTKLRHSSPLNSTMGGTSVSMKPQLLGMLNNLFVKNEVLKGKAEVSLDLGLGLGVADSSRR